jgi:hypothetical protein
MALVEGVDFYINAEGLMVFTAVYLRLPPLPLRLPETALGSGL